MTQPPKRFSKTGERGSQTTPSDTEARLRKESIALKERMAAIKDQARTAGPRAAERLKREFLDLQKRREALKSRADDHAAKRGKSENTEDAKYRASRAEHFAVTAQKAHAAHTNAKTPAEKLQHAATAAHAADRAAEHADFVAQQHPGSELADKATLSAALAKHAHEEIQANKESMDEPANALVGALEERLTAMLDRLTKKYDDDELEDLELEDEDDEDTTWDED